LSGDGRGGPEPAAATADGAAAAGGVAPAGGAAVAAAPAAAGAAPGRFAAVACAGPGAPPLGVWAARSVVSARHAHAAARLRRAAETIESSLTRAKRGRAVVTFSYHGGTRWRA